MENPQKEKQIQTPRFVVQLFSIDNDQSNPVQNAYAVQCSDRKQMEMLYELLQRHIQILSYKPIDM